MGMGGQPFEGAVVCGRLSVNYGLWSLVRGLQLLGFRGLTGGLKRTDNRLSVLISPERKLAYAKLVFANGPIGFSQSMGHQWDTNEPLLSHIARRGISVSKSSHCCPDFGHRRPKTKNRPYLGLRG